MDLRKYSKQFGTEELNVNDYQEDAYSLIPNGKYEAIVTKADVKETLDRMGVYISVLFKITDTKSNGRTVFANINYINQNDNAQKIGRQQLATLMKSNNIAVLNDSDELINARALITVETSEWNGEKRNSVKNIAPSKANTMPQQNSSAVQNNAVTSQVMPAQMPTQQASQPTPRKPW